MHTCVPESARLVAAGDQQPSQGDHQVDDVGADFRVGQLNEHMTVDPHACTALCQPGLDANRREVRTGLDHILGRRSWHDVL